MNQEQLDKRKDVLLLSIQKEQFILETIALEKSSHWLTDGFLVLNFEETNIKTVKERSLLKLVTDLCVYQNFAAKAKKILNLDSDSTTYICGYPYASWFSDCTRRMDIIKISNKIQDLYELENNLLSIKGTDKKSLTKLEDIAKDLFVYKMKLETYQSVNNVSFVSLML